MSKMKDKNHMVISTDIVKAFDNAQNPFIETKTLNKLDTERICLNLVEVMYCKATANIILKSENQKAFYLQ